MGVLARSASRRRHWIMAHGPGKWPFNQESNGTWTNSGSTVEMKWEEEWAKEMQCDGEWKKSDQGMWVLSVAGRDYEPVPKLTHDMDGGEIRKKGHQKTQRAPRGTPSSEAA